MEKILQSVRRYEAGTKLPIAYPSLAAQGIDFFQGSLHLTAAGPGVGKTNFAWNHAWLIKVPTLVLSMDTPRGIMMTRMGQMVSGRNKDEVEYLLDNRDPALLDLMAKEDWLSTSFRAGPDVADIGNEVMAYGEVHGYWPQLLIVDNLINVHHGLESPYLGQGRVMESLDWLAKELGICVHVLTHVSGEYKSGMKPIPQDGVMNKLTELPHSVLTLTRTELPTQLMVACVKNRTGLSDPNGMTRYPLRVDVETMRVTDD